jgi:hypothetical protein
VALPGGVLLIVIYFGRLFDFITAGDYTSLPPNLFGFAVHPLFYAWLGLVLWRARAASDAEPPLAAAQAVRRAA